MAPLSGKLNNHLSEIDARTKTMLFSISPATDGAGGYYGVTKSRQSDDKGQRYEQRPQSSRGNHLPGTNLWGECGMKLLEE